MGIGQGKVTGSRSATWWTKSCRIHAAARNNSNNARQLVSSIFNRERSFNFTKASHLLPSFRHRRSDQQSGWGKRQNRTHSHHNTLHTLATKHSNLTPAYSTSRLLLFCLDEAGRVSSGVAKQGLYFSFLIPGATETKTVWMEHGRLPTSGAVTTVVIGSAPLARRGIVFLLEFF